MSVINQMLNGLEERGVQIEAGEIRPVRTGRRRVKWGLVVLLSVPLWLYLRPHAADRAPAALAAMAPAASVAAPVAAPVVAPVVAPAASSASSASAQIASAEKTDPKPVKEKPAMEKGQAVAAPKTASQLAVGAPLKAVPAAKDASEAHKAAEQKAAEPVAPVIKEVSPAQAADAEYRRALQYAQQGKIAEALGGLESALRLDAGHDAARQAMVALLLESRRSRDAEQILQQGLLIKPENTGFAMLLARLQIQRNELDAALATLEKTLAAAGNLAEYQAFYAALLQRKGRHEEALDHYRVALKSAPDNGLWLMGCGISSQALARSAEAKGFFLRALEVKTLSPELQVFVQQKLAALNGQ